MNQKDTEDTMAGVTCGGCLGLRTGSYLQVAQCPGPLSTTYIFLENLRPHAYTDIMEPWGWGWHNRLSVRRTLGKAALGSTAAVVPSQYLHPHVSVWVASWPSRLLHCVCWESPPSGGKWLYPSHIGPGPCTYYKLATGCLFSAPGRVASSW